MSKFGSMNNFQLTREAYSIKQRLDIAEQNVTNIERKTKEIAEIVFDNNELNIKEFIKTINKSVDTTILKKRIDLLEKKTEKRIIHPIQISNEEKEELKKFLNELELSYFYSNLIEMGVRTIEDILFLTEEDLLLHGFSIIPIRKCLESAKVKAETTII